MANWGAKVSQKGYPVGTCADRFLTFSSSFPTLKVFSTYSVSTTIPASGTNTITISHNLGYYAPYLVVYNGSTTLGQNVSYFGTDADNLNVLDARQYINKLEINIDQNFDQYSSSVGDTVYFTVYIFLDKIENYTSSIVKTSTSSGSSSNNYGFKISKAGYNVNTCTDEQLVMSSSFYSALIHKKGSQTATGTGSVTINHNLLYEPLTLGFIKDSGLSYMYSSNPSISSTEISSPIIYNGDIFYYLIFMNKLT